MANNKRSGKFYRNNEKSVMESLGFTPTYNSGSSWVEKEDGQNEYAICQLKSTDARSIKVDQKDIEKLEYNALVSHKIPVFAIQFLNTNEVFLVIRPEHLSDLVGVVKGGTPKEIHSEFLGLEKQVSEAQRDISESSKGFSNRVIKSSSEGRESFMKSNAERYKKQSKSAK